MADSTSIPLGIGQQKSGVPMTADNKSALVAALQGGTATSTFFQNQNVGQNFTNYVGTAGQSAWIASTDETTGNPVYFAAQQSGANSQAMVVQANIDQNAISSNTPSGSFSYNGQNYNILGSLEMTISYNTTPQWYFQAPLAVAEAYPFMKLTGIAWSSLLKPLLQRAANGVSSLFGNRNVPENGGDIANAGDDAAGDIAGDGIQAGEGITIDIAAGLGALGGMAVLVGLPVLLEALAHSTTHNLQVYNLTPYNITWSIAAQPHGTNNLAPTSSASATTPDYVIAGAHSYAPPGITPVPCAVNAAFGFVSQSGYTGIAYVMTFVLTDPTTKQQIDSFAVMFDIPFTGDNSVSVMSGTPSDAGDWYDDQAGKNTVTSASATGNTTTMAATYDYLDGQHPGPGGQNQYIYNSLLVFDMKTA